MMAATFRCNFTLYSYNKPIKIPNPNYLPINIPPRNVCPSTKTPNFSHSRLERAVSVSALVSEENATGSISPSTDAFKLTYLEGNSWLWEVGGVKLLVDPILVGNLDFGIPWLYDAAKKFLKNFQLSDLPEVDCLLITQSLDDHCHLKTLKPFSAKFPNLRVISTPNAQAKLDTLFRKVTYLEPGQNAEIEGKNGSKVRIRATAGPVLGPPWQRPESGYLVSSSEGPLTLYFEPHCVYNGEFLKKEKADIVITPVIKQLLPSVTLVSGQEDAVRLAKLLCAKFIVPMKNGDLDSKGILASIVQSEGTVESYKSQVQHGEVSPNGSEKGCMKIEYKTGRETSNSVWQELGPTGRAGGSPVRRMGFCSFFWLLEVHPGGWLKHPIGCSLVQRVEHVLLCFLLRFGFG